MENSDSMKTLNPLKEYKPINFIFGLLYSMAIVLGFQCEYFGQIDLRSWKTYTFFLLLFFIATVFSKLIWDLILEKTVKKSNSLKKANDEVSKDRTWFFSSIIIWIGYFIVFLGEYPGFFTYDALDELNEVVTRTFNNQYPMLHVLSLGGTIQAIHKLSNDYNLSIAVFIILQMSIISAVLGYLVKILKEDGLGKIGAILFSIYLGVFPVLSMFALCSSKDGLFGAALLITVIYLRKLLSDFRKFGSERKNWIILTIASVLMMLFRSNGVYAFTVFAAVLLVFLFIKSAKYGRQEKVLKKVLLYTVVSVTLFFAINKGLLLATNASSIGHREILTVPIQQLARVYCYDAESLNGTDKSIIESYIPLNTIKRYNPKCSDGVKIDFNEQNFENNKAQFFNIWLKTGLSHPIAYLDALCMTGYGMWYPQATIDGYKGNEVYTFVYGDSSYFGYEVEPPGQRKPKLPYIDDFYRWLSLNPTIHRIPIVRFLFSPGFWLWVYIFVIGYFVYSRQSKKALAYSLPLIVVLTCFIGPMSLVRYAFYLWYFVPMAIFDIRNTAANV